MENRKAVSFKMEQEQWYKLKIIALKKKTNLNEMLEGIVNQFIAKEENNETNI